MSDILNCALSLASQQVRLFPVVAGAKIPAVKDFSHKATSDAELLTKLFGQDQFNSGIATGKVAEGLYLVGFDIDVKKGKDGYALLELLEELGLTFPDTWAQKTPSGGEHRLFWSHVPIRQGVDVVGKGIDLRGEGGYLVGPGSRVELGAYRVIHDAPIAKFPSWAIEKYQQVATVHSLPSAKKGKPIEDQVTALKRSVAYLQAQPMAEEGNRSHECFRIVAQLKDFGLAHEQVHEILLSYWQCYPMLDDEELLFTINNAYRYAKNSPGVLAPENLFDPVEEEATAADATPTKPPETGSPLEGLNKDHFYYASNGVSRVCWETSVNGQFYLERFPVANFHEKHQAIETYFDGKDMPLTKAWMKWKKRRTYDGLRFDPSGTLDKKYYNLWRGFAVKMPESPITPSPLAAESVNLFLDHVRKNVCGGDETLADWLLTFMAHMFQHPGQKPEVALVMKGLKGTGKTIISEILGHLIGEHAVILADKNSVVGNFNSIMEDKILVTLDEAFWSGDKAVEGTLKHIITGRQRVITHKGHEPYKAKVFDRIIIVGNENWLVPATGDERRFAVFDVSSARRQDRTYFGRMKEGILDHGGDQLLMKFFMEWDLSKGNVNVAPNTKALSQQKELSLNEVQNWWKECLDEGRLIGSGKDFIPENPDVKEVYESFAVYNARYGRRLVSRISFGMILRSLLPANARDHKKGVRIYHLGTLAGLRAAWDEHFNYKVEWSDSLSDLL